jgi:TatD DNase family protein
MSLIDTHCHLLADPLAADIPGVLDRARRAGVSDLVLPAVDRETSAVGLELARRTPGLHAAVGLHPQALPVPPEDLAAVLALARAGGAVALGEIGLDADPAHRSTLPAQRAALAAQLAVARELGLPVLLHARGGFAALLELLRPLGPGGPGGVLHAYAGSVEVARELDRLGYGFGVAGVICRPTAVRVRSVVARLPLDRLVLETDAPFIATGRASKGRVEPADLPEIAEALAELKGETVERIAEITSDNAQRMLGLGT